MSYFRHGDPLDDFDRLDRRQARYEARLPKCDICRQPIQDEDLYDLGDELVCHDCLDKHYRRKTEDYIN